MSTETTTTESSPAETPTTVVERQGDNARASWRMSGDHIQQALAYATPERKEALIWAFNWCINRSIFFEDFCKQVGYAPNTVYKILAGKHVDPKTGVRYDIPEKLYDAVGTFRKHEVKRAKLGETQFVHTPLCRRITQGCDLARESRTPVFLYGASHIGKTWALRHYAIENNHGRTVLIRVPSKGGLNTLIHVICAAVGVSPKSNTPELIERIKRSLAPNHLLIFDEFHQLQYTYRKESMFACVEVIREIYDHVECGMVIATTNVFRSKLESARKDELEQMFRRGVHKIQLGDIVRAEDLKPILDQAGLGWPGRKLKVQVSGVTESPHEVLRQLSREGGLKAITERLRYGRLIAGRASSPLSWEHVMHAHLIIERNAQIPEDDWE